MTADAKPKPAGKPDAKPQAKRRWYQFSLRAMFVGVTVVAVLLTVGVRCVAPAQRQRAIVRFIDETGGYVGYVRPPLHESRPTTWMRSWLPRDYFDSVDAVYLDRTQVTDAGLTHLSGLTQLQVLWLQNTQVTDAGLAHLSGLTQLQVLWLTNTQVTDAGLAHLSGLTQLQVLWLTNTQVTDAGLAALRKALPNCAIAF